MFDHFLKDYFASLRMDLFDNGAMFLNDKGTYLSVSLDGLMLYPLFVAFAVGFAKMGQNVMLYGTAFRPNENPQHNVIGIFHLLFWLGSFFFFSLIMFAGALIVAGNQYSVVIGRISNLLFR